MKRAIAATLGRRRYLIIFTVVVVLAISVMGGALGEALGLGFLAGPLPEISVAPEVATKVGGLSLYNTTIMLWVTGLVLITLALIVRFRLKLVPRGLQNVFESVFEYFQNMADGIGGKKARSFLTISVLIFLVVLISNWLGILPVAGPVGRLEPAGEWVEIHASADVGKLENELATANVHTGHEEIEALAVVTTIEHNPDRRFPVFEESGGVALLPFGRGQQALARLDQIVLYDVDQLHDLEKELRAGVALGDLKPANHGLWESIEDDLMESKVQTLIEGTNGVTYDLRGKSTGILVPYLRGASTDIHTTLAIALVAMVSIQFFGFRALGFRGYGGKFINLSVFRFRGGLFDGIINFVLGILEIIGEIARTISFTFRLFGNLFAGEVLIFAMSILVPIIGLVPFYGLELFVGLIQAFIFATLTLVFANAATLAHSDH